MSETAVVTGCLILSVSSLHLDKVHLPVRRNHRLYCCPKTSQDTVNQDVKIDESGVSVTSILGVSVPMSGWQTAADNINGIATKCQFCETVIPSALVCAMNSPFKRCQFTSMPSSAYSMVGSNVAVVI